jgi:Peptidase family S41
VNLYKKGILLLSLLLTFSAFAQTVNYDPGHLYTTAELKTDFQFLRGKLEKKHPNLYLYTPKAEMNLFFDSLYNSIDKPSAEIEFYNLITLLNSKIKDGHTMMLPGEEATDYFSKNEKFFPFYVFIKENKLYVNMNCSPDTSIKTGAEILSINGKSAPEIMSRLLSRQIRDGNNETYPNWILNNYFKEYFSFSFGLPSHFSITYRENISETQTKTIDALSKDSIRFYKQSRYSHRTPGTNDKQGIILEIDTELKTASLTIKSFDKDILKNQYRQNFRTAIEKIFKQIESSKIHSLILDLRNNQGGDFENGRILLSYLITQQIKYLETGNESRMIIPKANNFKGDLYILINGGSFSNTAIVSSYLELINRGVFIGEETGGNKTVISGNAADITLPNTKLACQISGEKFIIRTGKNDGHGIIPAYFVSPTIKDIVENKDAEKEFAANLIKKKL